jgi:hypothetical protein
MLMVRVVSGVMLVTNVPKDASVIVEVARNESPAVEGTANPVNLKLFMLTSAPGLTPPLIFKLLLTISSNI